MHNLLPDKKEQHIILKDGRKLGYADFGKEDGFRVLLFHGTPGSRLWFTDDDTKSIARGLRLIAVDRPGFGISDRKIKRTVLDWPNDVIELADQLQLNRFSVVGVSGGGVYAASCAYSIPVRIVSAVLVSSVAPFENGKPPKKMCLPNRLAFFLSKNLPWLLRITYKTQKKLMHENASKYLTAIQNQVSHLCESDKHVLQSATYAQMLLVHMKEALRNGVEEAVSEPALLSRNWGFNCAEIKARVHIWHGMEDTLAPLAEIQKLGSLIPSAHTHLVKNKGHFIIEDEKVWDEILLAISLDKKETPI
jgi:pimeloyl-ACP methyl ester carboxylesterase